jgi:hypothetical protein
MSTRFGLRTGCDTPFLCSPLRLYKRAAAPSSSPLFRPPPPPPILLFSSTKKPCDTLRAPRDLTSVLGDQSTAVVSPFTVSSHSQSSSSSFVGPFSLPITLSLCRTLSPSLPATRVPLPPRNTIKSPSLPPRHQPASMVRSSSPHLARPPPGSSPVMASASAAGLGQQAEAVGQSQPATVHEFSIFHFLLHFQKII